ncbi:MAG: hypothetical protein ACI978_001199 [Oleispira sp.]|jgi:hypothetical protein
MKLIKNTRGFAVSIVLPLMFVVASVHAHGPDEHTKEPEVANCDAMKTMDHEKMDMNDPVVQALIKKCMNKMHGKHSKGMHKTEIKDVNGDKPGALYEGHSHKE